MVTSAAQLQELPFARRERLAFLEAMLLWAGSVTRRDIAETFGVTLNHVTRDLDIYQQRHRDHIVFDPRKHAYVAGPQFTPAYASADPAEHLGLLRTHAETGSSSVVPLLGTGRVPVATLPTPAMGIDQDALAAVLRAIRLQRGLQLTYHSLRAGHPQEANIWPHALMHTGLRWYARAYDEASDTFRDFVLSRMQKPRALGRAAPRFPDTDHAWSTYLRAEIIPHPGLNAHQQRVVAREYAMTRRRIGWAWSIKLRQSVVGYFARRYKLDAEPPVSPRSHWIVLRNRDELKPFFLSGEND